MENEQAEQIESQLQTENTAELPERSLEHEADLIRAGLGPINGWVDIPPRFRGKALQDLKGMDKKVADAKAAIEEGKSLFITGACGTGKTHLALGLLLEWCALTWVKPETDKRLGRHARFIPWVELLMEIKRGFSESNSEWQLIQRYTELDLLVLDDLGAERISEWSKEECYAIIDRRYRSMKQTVVTSNLNLDQIAKALDDRIASRLVEMGKIIQLEGEDYRLKRVVAPAPVKVKEKGKKAVR